MYEEIDAHIADRFLEAVWREGLWLIKDGIATTEEIDNAIRYGFGLRWAQMDYSKLIALLVVRRAWPISSRNSAPV